MEIYSFLKSLIGLFQQINQTLKTTLNAFSYAPENKMIQSPLNYTCSKFKLLPQLLPLFPRKVDIFVDLFYGGCNVGINVEAKKHVYNDINLRLIYLFHTLKNLNKNIAFEMIYPS